MNDNFSINGVTYRQLMTNCGSKDCKKCKENGPSHGPYWYGFREGTKKYIGKELPANITQHLELLESERKKLEDLRDQLKQQKEQLYAEYKQAEDEEVAVSALLRGDWVQTNTLQLLGLEKFSFNGHKK